MIAVTPVLHEHATLIVFAKDQPEYVQLPASVDGEGTVMTEWEFSAEELARVLNGGRLRLWVCYTGVVRGQPLTPLMIEVIDTRDETTTEDGHPRHDQRLA